MTMLVTLQEVSHRTGVSVRRLRYYISKGWLPTPVPVREGPGRPTGKLDEEAVDKVKVIDNVLRNGGSSVLDAVPLGLYVYELDGQRVQSNIVSKEECGAYTLIHLGNGDLVVRVHKEEMRDA